MNAKGAFQLIINPGTARNQLFGPIYQQREAVFDEHAERDCKKRTGSHEIALCN